VLNDRFPPSALSVGASIVVQSPHKTLGSLTQSSLLHTSGSLVDRSRLDGNLQMLQSSSPSALLLVSLDLAVDEMARVGRARWGTAIDLADELRMMIGCHRGLYACGKEAVGTPGVAGYDPTKVVVDVHGIGTTGFAAAAWLRTHAGVNPEFSDLRRMVFSVTFADDHASITLLAEALGALAREGASASGRGALVSEWPAALPEMCLTPREAAGRPTHAVPVAEAVDRICGEMVIPYPPGIPLLVPGERISDGVVAAIEQFAGARSRIVGVADATGATLRCIAP
jgi:arginine/lysine/ornithine decarboxylase